MAKTSFSGKWGRVSANVTRPNEESGKSTEDVVREIKKAAQKPAGEDYRERSLAIHGLVCARCGREHGLSKRHLLTVHHKDGNHFNNPPDGSNWENLCVYCHEDIHSRGVLGDYLKGATPTRDTSLVFGDENAKKGAVAGLGALGEKLRQAMEKKQKID